MGGGARVCTNARLPQVRELSQKLWVDLDFLVRGGNVQHDGDQRWWEKRPAVPRRFRSECAQEVSTQLSVYLATYGHSLPMKHLLWAMTGATASVQPPQLQPAHDIASAPASSNFLAWYKQMRAVSTFRVGTSRREGGTGWASVQKDACLHCNKIGAVFFFCPTTIAPPAITTAQSCDRTRRGEQHS
jgi:hypothetical protein